MLVVPSRHEAVTGADRVATHGDGLAGRVAAFAAKAVGVFGAEAGPGISALHCALTRPTMGVGVAWLPPPPGSFVIANPSWGRIAGRAEEVARTLVWAMARAVNTNFRLTLPIIAVAGSATGLRKTLALADVARRTSADQGGVVQAVAFALLVRPAVAAWRQDLRAAAREPQHTVAGPDALAGVVASPGGALRGV